MSTRAFNPMWRSAAALAARAHAGQPRKDGKTPYIAHPVRVTLILCDVFDLSDPALLAAALLHDVIEDTPLDYEDIVEACDIETADLVAAMTKDMRLPEAEREPAYDAGLAAASWKARAIKLADTLDNLLDDASARRRSKAIAKVRRALALAGNDPVLAPACAHVRAVLADLSASDDATGNIGG